MKNKKTGKGLLYLMLLIVIFSLGLTTIIVAGLIDDVNGSEETYWFFTKSKEYGEVVELKNAYIYSAENDQVGFVYDDVAYLVPGKLTESYTGLADIIIEGGKISKICVRVGAQATEPIQIRVVLKNGSEIVHHALYVRQKSTGAF